MTLATNHNPNIWQTDSLEDPYKTHGQLSVKKNLFRGLVSWDGNRRYFPKEVFVSLICLYSKNNLTVIMKRADGDEP